MYCFQGNSRMGLILLFVILYTSIHTTVCTNGTCSRSKLNVEYSLKYNLRLLYYKQTYTYSCGFWNFYTCYSTRTRYYYQRYSYNSSITKYLQQYFCCDGYSGNVSTACKPICNQGCVHGVCTSPEVCECNSGWDGGSCERDINECLNENGGCEQICNNINGSYTCSCGDGYRLKNDNHDCQDIDECEEGLVMIGKPTQENFTSNEANDLWCDQKCVNTNGSFVCDCEKGYYLQYNNQSCSDIDECAISNGGCNHTCHNIKGSYYCTCEEGFFLLQDYRGCKDHDECSVSAHLCEQKCYNTLGGYVCGCYDGFQLQGSTNCTDINECDEGISGCSDLCHNDIGFFHCLCNEGYLLSPEDNVTCYDVDECESSNGGCAHLCVNQPGSYECQCREGYLLSSNNHNCYGKACNDLVSPPNGDIKCTGPQVTDESCTFTCHTGYSLSGSSKRTCLINQTWSGEDPVCKPVKCSELTSPAKALVTYPCDTNFMSSCAVLCEKGYHVKGQPDRMNRWSQTCALGTENSTVEWTDAMECIPIETDACNDSPCQPGLCSTSDERGIDCDCEGTFHTGERCELAFIDISPLPILQPNKSHNVRVTSQLSSERVLTFGDQWKLISSMNLTIPKSSHERYDFFTINGNSPGIYSISYNVNPLNNIRIPDDSIVLVTNAAPETQRNNYFDVLGLEEGILSPGCCSTSNLVSKQPLCRSDLVFFSSCDWIVSDFDVYSSKGVIFVASHTFSLPLSISGTSINISSSFSTSLPFNSGVLSQHCLACDQENAACLSTGSFVPFNEYDTEILLSHHSLLKTMLSQIKPSFPSWLSISALSMSTNPSYHLYDYASSLVLGKNIKMIRGCEALSIPDKENLYYVLRSTVPLLVEIDSLPVLLRDTSSKPHCIVIDVCGSIYPLVYSIVPANLQPLNLVGLKYFERLLADNGKLVLDALTLSEVGIIQFLQSNTKFWNGSDYFTPVLPTYEFEVFAELDKVFISNNDLKVNVIFEGLAFHTSELSFSEAKVPGMMIGKMHVGIFSVVGGSPVSLQLHSPDEISLFSFPGTSVSTQHSTLPPGISFKMSFKNQNSSFLSDILVLPDHCSTGGFLSLDTFLHVNSLTLVSNCAQLRIGQLQLPNTLYHITHFHGKHTISKASITFYSKLQTSAEYAMMGDYFKILPSEEKPYVMELSFSSSNNFGYGLIYNSNVSIFDAELNAKLHINGTTISFQGNCMIFNGYNVNVYGTASTQSSIDVHLSIEILDMFKSNLTSRINSNVKSEYNNAMERRMNIEKSLENMNYIHSKISESMKGLSKQIAALNQILQKANESFIYWSDKVLDVEHALNELVVTNESLLSQQNVLLEKNCEYVCAKDNTCSSCNYTEEVTETSVCQKPIVKNRSVTHYQLVEVKSQRYETKCHPCWRLIWYALPYSSSYNCCSTESVQYTTYREVPYESIESYIEIESTTCVTGAYNETFSGYCCKENMCDFKVPNVSCLVENAFIREETKRAINSVDYDTLSSLYLNYSKAKENLTLSELEMILIKNNIFSLESEIKLLSAVRHNIFLAREARKEDRDQVFESTEDYYLLFNDTKMNSFQEEYIKIHEVSFDVFLTSYTPVSLPVNFRFEYENQISVITVTVNFLNPIETIIQKVSKEIFGEILSMHILRKKRETSNQTDFNSYISAACASIKNIESFFSQANESFQTSLTKHRSALTVLEVDGPIKEKSPLSEVSAFAQQLKNTSLNIDYSVISSKEKLRKFLVEYSLFQWQANINILYRNGIDTLGHRCVSFVDCIQVSLNDLLSILEDTSMPQSLSIIQSVLCMKINVLGIGLNYSYTFSDAVSVFANFMPVFEDIYGIGYWCSNAPSIIQQPALEINISVGETLEILCQVHSILPVQYFWRKDSKLLSSKASILRIPNIQLSEKGKYYCTAVNDAGSTSLLSTTVNVFSSPILNSTLKSIYETYAGDDNVTFLVCDAYSVPLSGWKWFYQSLSMNVWTEIENVKTNILTITKPTLKDEGWYKCMAYNQIGNVNSTAAFLRILPAKFSTIHYSISVNMQLISATIVNTSRPLIFNLKSLAFTAVSHLLQLSSTELKDFQFLEETRNEFRLSFILSTPYIDYNMTVNTQEVVAMTGSAVADLEAAVSTFSNISSHGAGFQFGLENIEFQSVSKSLFIGPRHFVCPNGYQIHSNLILCVGCSPGQYGGKQYTEYTDLDSGEILEQVVPRCVDCPFGQYASDKLLTECQQCPENHGTLSKGSTSQEKCIALCEPHTFSFNGFEPCTPCPPYHNQPGFGSIRCLERNSTSSKSLEFRSSVLPFRLVTSLMYSPSIEVSDMLGTDQANMLLTLTLSSVSVVLLVLIIVAVVLVLIFAILNRRTKRKQFNLQQSHAPSQSHPYTNNEIKAMAEYDNKEYQIDHMQTMTVLDEQPIYEDIRDVDTSEYISPKIDLPNLPPRKSQEGETSSMKSNKDYMPMDAMNLVKEPVDKETSDIPVSPCQKSENTETVSIKSNGDYMDVTDPAQEVADYEIMQTANSIAHPPGLKSKNAENISIKSNDDYMPMNVTNPAHEVSDYEMMKIVNSTADSPGLKSENFESSLIKSDKQELQDTINASNSVVETGLYI